MSKLGEIGWADERVKPVSALKGGQYISMCSDGLPEAEKTPITAEEEAELLAATSDELLEGATVPGVDLSCACDEESQEPSEVDIIMAFIHTQMDDYYGQQYSTQMEYVVRPIIEKIVNKLAMAHKGWNRWVHLRNEQYERAEKLVKERDTAREQRDHWVRLHEDIKQEFDKLEHKNEAMAECVAILRETEPLSHDPRDCNIWMVKRDEALAKFEEFKNG